MKKAALSVKDSAQGAAEGSADGRNPDDYAQRRGQDAAKDAFRTAADGITRRKRQGADGRDGGGSSKQGEGRPRTRERMQRRAAERRAKKRGADASVKGHAERQANIKKRNAPAVKSKGRVLKKNVRHRQSALPRPFGASAMPARMRQKAAAEYAAKQMAVKAAKKKAAAKTAKAAGAALMKSLRAILAALHRLILAIGAGSSVAVVVVILIIVVAAILGSALGIFFSNEAGGGMAMGEAVVQLTDEFGDRIEKIKADNPHDELEVVYVGGSAGIDWKAVVSVYAVKTAEDPEGPTAVIALDEENLERLRTVMDDMNVVTYATRTEERTRTATTIGEDGEDVETTETFTVTVLTITITKKTADEMAAQYGFTASQKESLAELSKPEYDDLWRDLLGAGAFRDAGGEHRQPSPDRIPTGIFSWPLDQAGEITSWFGWREDPFTGEWKYHDGVDIGVPDGTPILAAADGTVTVANMTDSYAGGWGYYVRVSHAGGYETLYAHCSALAVRQGDAVTKGQVIAYVGSTGRSTGNHLHWEVYLNGSRVDPLLYFE